MFDAREFALERGGVERVADTHLQALNAHRLDDEIDGAGAHRRHHIVDAAMGGLHDHRHIDRGLPQPRQHAEPVEIRHHQIEDHAIDPRAVAAEQGQRRIAVVEHHRLIAGFLQHGLEQPALHRIVIDNEDGHLLVPASLQHAVPFRVTLRQEA